MYLTQEKDLLTSVQQGGRNSGPTNHSGLTTAKQETRSSDSTGKDCRPLKLFSEEIDFIRKQFPDF